MTSTWGDDGGALNHSVGEYPLELDDQLSPGFCSDRAAGTIVDAHVENHPPDVRDRGGGLERV